MGISGLLPLLKDSQEEIHISKYKGKTLGVDAYVWLHRGAYGCAQQLALGQPTTSYVKFAMNKVNMLKYHGITPYIVFDGGPLPAKANTEVERAKRRNDNLTQAKKHLSHGRTQQAREYFTKCVDVTPAMAYQFIKALRIAQIDYIVAPYEADAQLAYLERRGTIQGVITEDSDLIVFGCKTVLYKLNDEGRCIELLHENRNRCKSLQFSLFTDAHFRQMAILSGCDYLTSIPGMGLKTAHRLLKQCGSVARALAAARMEGMKVPATYQRDFEMAEKTFVFQRVFHRSTKTGQTRMVTLTPCTGQTGIEEENCIGPLLPDELIEAISRGDVDPITRLPIEDLVPTSSLPLARSKSMTNLPSTTSKSKWIRETQSAGQKTLDIFFSKRQPMEQSEKAQVFVRKPLAPVTNIASRSIPQYADTLASIATEKSRFFVTATSMVESSPIEVQTGFDHHLASFTPTQSKRALSRCLSTDSGEISSPASSSIKRVKEPLHSSPLIEEDDGFSPNTSQTAIRPRTSKSKSPIKEGGDSDVEEEEEERTIRLENMEASLFERFAFQQQEQQQQQQQQQTTPLIPKREHATLKRSIDSDARDSISSSKRRFTALLQFHHEDEDDIFGITTEQTPTIKRSHSASLKHINHNDRPLSIKRINTTSK